MKVYAARANKDSETIFQELKGKDLWVKVNMKDRDYPGYFRLISYTPGEPYYFNYVPEWGIGTGRGSIALDMIDSVNNGGLNRFEVTHPIDILTTEELRNAIITPRAD